MKIGEALERVGHALTTQNGTSDYTTELAVIKGEVRRAWRVEDLVWDKLAAEGEHGEEHLEQKLSLNLLQVMLAVDPDGTIFERPYKIQPKALETEWLRSELTACERVYETHTNKLRAENAELRSILGRVLELVRDAHS